MIILNNLVNTSQRMEDKNTQIDIDARYRTKDTTLFLHIRIILKEQLDFPENKNTNIQS